MGWFNQEKVFVSSVYLPLVENTPNVISQAIMSSIFKGSELVPDMLDAINGSLGTKLNRYYTYGKDKFTNGLPEGTIGTEKVDDIELVRILTFLYPPSSSTESIIITGSTYDTGDYINVTAVARTYLYKRPDYQYNPSTEQIWYEGNTWNISGYTYNTANQIEIHIWREIAGGQGEIAETKIKFTPDYPIKSNEKYVIANYQYVDETNGTSSPIYYWYYMISTGRYPDLNPEFSVTQFMPIVPLRINNEDYTSTSRRNTALFKTSEKLLKVFDLDILELAGGINASPDIGDIDHAYFVLGVNLHTNEEVGNLYLFDFFQDMYAKQRYTKETFDNWLNQPVDWRKKEPATNNIYIEDVTYKTTLGWLYIQSSLKFGSIGSVGKVTKSIDGSHAELRVGIYSGDGGDRYVSVENPDNKIVLRKQLTANTYQEISAHGLMFANRVYIGNKLHTCTLSSYTPDNGQLILVPMNVDLAYSLNPIQRNALVYSSFHLVINAVEEVKLKWYQTSFFSFVTKVVAIALAIYSGGTSLMIQSLMLAASAGVVALGIVVAKMIVVAVLASAAFKYAAEKLGAELALILAAILIAYGVVGGDTALSLPMADTLLQVGTQLSQGVTDAVTEEFSAVSSAMAELSSEYQEKMAELQAVQDKLNNVKRINDPLNLFTEVGMLPMESSDSYLLRMTGSTMYNDIVINSVGNYVNNNLTLTRGKI